MAGDPDRLALAGEACLGIMAGALLQARRVRALDDDDVEVDVRDDYSADALAGGTSSPKRSASTLTRSSTLSPAILDGT